MKILLAEGVDSARVLIADALRFAGFDVETAEDGLEAAELAELYNYDGLIAGDGLGDLDANGLLRRLRAGHRRVPILMLRAAARVEDVVWALNAGADDYLGRPFHKDELICRLRAVIRRSAGHASRVISCGPIAYDLDDQSLTVDGRPIHLTGKERAVVEALMLRRGRIVTRGGLFEVIYNGLDEAQPKVIDVFICKVRAKLRRAGADGHLQTLWGQGYRFTETPGAEVEAA
ncbi:MAG: response regulator transcription factor [Proteobacteria bacterium]|nr:response regulator transcription factor [Pseudomonadota bacterium]